MAITESDFRRRLAAALTGTGLAACGKQGPAVSAVLAECRAAGLELAPPDIAHRLDLIDDHAMCRGYSVWRVSNQGEAPFSVRETAYVACNRYDRFPALEARAARLAAALGELLRLAEQAGIGTAGVWLKAVAEGQAALAEGGGS